MSLEVKAAVVAHENIAKFVGDDPAKDIPPPKRSRHAYTFFVQENFKRISKLMRCQHPQLILRELAVVWKNLSKEDRIPFFQKQTKDHDRYLADRAKFLAVHNGKRPRRYRKPRKRFGEPKHVRNAFIMFSQDAWAAVRIKKPELSKQQEMIHYIAEWWGKLPWDKKSLYKGLAERDGQRYKIEMTKYRQFLSKRSEEIRLDRMEKRKQDGIPPPPKRT